MISIILSYLERGAAKAVRVELSPADYFDLDEGEVATLDSVPGRQQPYLYTGKAPRDLVYAKLVLAMDGANTTFRQVFWDEGNSFLTERIDSGAEEFRELILTVRTPGDTGNDMIIRLRHQHQFWLPVYHGFFATSDDGSDTEQQIETTMFKNLVGENKSIELNS